MAEGTAAVGSVALGGECCEPREGGAIASRMSFEMPENLDGRGSGDGERESRGREQGGAKGEAAAAAVRACETMCPRHRVPFGTPLKPADGEGREDAYAAFLKEHTSANEAFDDSIARRLRGKHVALFLDYDGTLTPIVNDPDQALLSEEMRDTVRRLARVFPTAIVSGRGRLKVEAFVGLPELYYAGSHGMDIVGPKSGPWSTRGEVGREPDPALAAAMRVVDGRLRAALASIPGAAVEDNKFSITAHFRRCQCDADAERVKEATFLKVAELMANPPVLDAQLRFPLLKVSSGRKVLEVKPMNSWDDASHKLPPEAVMPCVLPKEEKSFNGA